jgi:hypothetical protein
MTSTTYEDLEEMKTLDVLKEMVSSTWELQKSVERIAAHVKRIDATVSALVKSKEKIFFFAFFAFFAFCFHLFSECQCFHRCKQRVLVPRIVHRRQRVRR